MIGRRLRPGPRARAMLAGAICLGLLSGSVFRAGAGAAPSPEMGTRTQGGLQPGVRVLHVQTLDDVGPGSLRAALDASGPRVIVFDVSGPIRLGAFLKIVNPYVTIAGETAPAPGVTLLGAPLIISTHDVVVEHIAIRPGRPRDPAFANRQDGVTIAAALDGSRPTRDILLRNLSISWGVDKAISIWRPDTRRFQLGTIRPSETARVTVQDCIVSEMLDNAGHPKGRHSMGIMIGRRVRSVVVTGVLFAHNRWRNPVIGSGAEAYVADNFVYDPGNAAIHFYTHIPQDGPTLADVEDNVVLPGPSSKPGLASVKVPPGGVLDVPGTAIFMKGNRLGSGEGTLDGPRGAWLARSSPLAPHGPPRPAAAVTEDVLRYAGYRPLQRDAVDARIVREVRTGTGHIIDGVDLRTGGPPPAGRRAPGHPPSDLAALRRWLCEARIAVGGRPDVCR